MMEPPFNLTNKAMRFSGKWIECPNGHKVGKVIWDPLEDKCVPGLFVKERGKPGELPELEAIPRGGNVDKLYVAVSKPFVEWFKQGRPDLQTRGLYDLDTPGMKRFKCSICGEYATFYEDVRYKEDRKRHKKRGK